MHGLTQQDKQMVAVTQNYSPSIFPRRLAFMVLNIPFLFFLPHTSIDFRRFWCFSFSNVFPILFKYVGGMFLSESIMR